MIAEDDNGTALGHYRLAPDGGASVAGCLGTHPTCTATIDFEDPSGIAISPDGRDVYVAADHRVVDFRRAADGSLTAAGCAGGPACSGANAYFAEPHAIAVSPNGRDVYVTDGDPGVFSPAKIAHFTRAADGSLSYADCTGSDIPVWDTPCTPLPAGVASIDGPLGMAVSPDGRNVYVSGNGNGLTVFDDADAVTHFRVADDGSLRFADCLGEPMSGCPGLPPGVFALDLTRSLAIDPSGRDVYTSAIGDSTIAHFALGPDGALSFASCVGFSPSPGCSFDHFGAEDDQAVTVSPDGKNLYAPGSGGLYTFALRPSPPVPTGTPATVTALDAVYVREFSAALRGHVAPHAKCWTDRFEYGTTTAYASYTRPASASTIGDGYEMQGDAEGLAPGTTYHYRLVVTTPAGAAYGPDRTFTTLAYPTHPPELQTLFAMGNSGTGTGLAAWVNPAGGATTYRFQWGETESLGHETPGRSLPGDGAHHSVEDVITGLTPGTDYYFRVVATNSAGTTYGLLGKFTADALPGMPTPTPTPEITPTPRTPPPPAAPILTPASGFTAAAHDRTAHRRPRLSHITMRRAGRGLLVTYRDTRHRTVVLTLRRGSHVVDRRRHHSHPGLDRIRWRVLRPGRYVIALRPSGAPAQHRRLRLRARR